MTKNNKKGLSARQIVNRFLKGVYVDENVDAISSAVADSPLPFCSVAVPFPVTVIEKVYGNIGAGKAMYELRREGRGAETVAVPDYPQLRDILLDLSEPDVWESMSVKDHPSFPEIIFRRGLKWKYSLDAAGNADVHKIESLLSSQYGDAVRAAGLDPFCLDLALYLMVKKGEGARMHERG